MIFDARRARAIAAGRVTVLLLPTRPGRAGAPLAPCRLKVACDVPVTTRGGGAPVTAIRVLSARREPLSALTLRLARSAGFRTTDELREDWIRRHDRAWIARHKIDLAAVFGDDVVPFILRERFARRWHDRLAWVVSFAVVTDPPRFLASQRGRAFGDGQYTPIAADAIDPAEAVPERWLDREAQRRAEYGERMRASFRRDLEEERALRAERATAGLSNRALRHVNGAGDRAT